MDVMEAIKTRRSVRRFKPDAIPDEVMSEILEAARWSPSWANTQCWEFIVVTDQATRTRLSEEVLAQGNPAKRGVAEAPAVVVALGKEGVAGFYKGPSTDKGDWFMYDVGVAMQNLCLAAWGFGTRHRPRGAHGRRQGPGDPGGPRRGAGRGPDPPRVPQRSGGQPAPEGNQGFRLAREVRREIAAVSQRPETIN